MKKIIIFLFFIVSTSSTILAQDMEYYKYIIKELSSGKFQGRGYAKKGEHKAGIFIEKEFRKCKVDTIFHQPFNIKINTFAGKMNFSVDGNELSPGEDFVMREYSPGCHGKFKLFYVDTLNYDSKTLFEALSKPENKDVFVVCDFWFTYKHKEDFKKLQDNGEYQNAGLIYIWDTPLKFYKAYGEKLADKPIIWVSTDFPRDANSVSADIDNRFIESYSCRNIIAKVKGERHDSCYAITAHYDHLGNLGDKLFFPGANDNASGTACMITMAHYFSINKPKFDIYFIAFSGEDANLRGSTYFTENPPMELNRIKYLFNIDMIGDNNPSQYCEISKEAEKGFSLMQSLNNKNGYFRELNRGELAANSDHYPFAQKAVPCILFENENGDSFKYYHTAEDNFENAVFDTYEPIFTLITNFIKYYD